MNFRIRTSLVVQWLRLCEKQKDTSFFVVFLVKMHNHLVKNANPINNTGQDKGQSEKYMISTLQKVSRSCNKEKLKAVREY